jgi:hypothetical protein
MATTTPNYGWDVPTSSDYVKDGALAIETLGDDIDASLYTALGGNYPGLRLIKKQTIGTAVSSVTVTGAFSATYEAYKIIVTGGVSSVADRVVNLQLSGSSTAYYYSFVYGSYSGGAPATVAGSNVSAINYVGLADSTNGISVNVDVMSPFLAKNTSFISSTQAPSIGGATNGVHTNTGSYTGFVLTPNTGTLTGGTIYVYGYGAS